MATKPPSAAQLAARKKFAEMARNGSLNRKRQIAAKKRAVNPIEENDVDKLRNEFEIYFAGEQKIAKRNGYRINKADEWIRFVDAARLKEQKKVKRNPAKKTVSQKISQLVHEGYPQRQAVAVALNEQRKGKVKRNPAGMVKGYAVVCMHPKPHTVAITTSMAEAKKIGQDYATRENVQVAIKPVSVHKAHFA